jgi:L,D-peptidoglycan transpeptidase YkuD (ErfK/YbiS/YcfS/YnhG family)
MSAQGAPLHLPGLGPKTLSEVPAKARQVVVVTGRGKNSPRSTVVLYRRTAEGWRAGATWPAHNALKGWSAHHTGGDLRSPVGVFGLSDAGGLRGDPGTRLPYHHSRGFVSPGTGFEGEPLAGSFDYVVAIDYNRKPGTSPLDWTRPLGAKRGGGIWFHVDHGGPTHGCVSVSEQHMKQLLRALDPALHPVVVMGDAASLAR